MEPATGAPMTPYAQIEASSARTFTLVGLVFYIVAAAIGGIGLTFATLALFVVPPFTPPFPDPTFFTFGLIFPVVFLGVGIGLTVWTWLTLQHIDAGRYQQAQAPTLVLGILGLFFAIVIGGIFLIVAYVKLGNALGPQPVAAAAPVAAVAATPAPVAGRMCPNCGRPVTMDSKFCNHCGQELPE